MDARNLRLDEFIDLMGQDCGFKVQPYHTDLLKKLCGSDRVIISWPHRGGKKWMMEMQRHIKFWIALNNILEQFNSIHPLDKLIANKLVEGGMTKEEVKQFRDLTLKASKAYYHGKENSDKSNK